MTDQRPRTALVAGASGLVGGELLELLLADPIVGRVHSLVRRLSGRTDPALAEQIVDFAQLSAAGLPPRADEAYCCLGTTMRTAGSREAFRRVDHDYVVAFGKLALALGARSLAVVSSVGADPSARSFSLRVKGEMEASLVNVFIRIFSDSGIAGLVDLVLIILVCLIKIIKQSVCFIDKFFRKFHLEALTLGSFVSGFQFDGITHANQYRSVFMRPRIAANKTPRQTAVLFL